MTWPNYDDVRQQLEGAGLILDRELQVGTTRPVRCKVEGDRERRGWYRLFELVLDGGQTLITGSFGIWRGDDNGAMKIELPKVERKRLDPQQHAAIRARQAEDKRRAEAERAAEVAKASSRATRWWAGCVDHGESPYLTKKGLPAGKLYGARLSPDGNLVIPLMDTSGQIYGLQVVYHAAKIKEKKGRDKDFTPPGLEKKSRHFMLGSPLASGGILLVAEGFATGASLHEATGLPVLITFDAGNILPACEAVKKHYRQRLTFVICADDDYLGKCTACGQWTPTEPAHCAHCGQAHGKRNTGKESAKLAAIALDGHVILPTWPADRPLHYKGPTDFNDLHVHPEGGLDAVRKQVEAVVGTLRAASSFVSRVTSPLAIAPGGGGEGDAMPSVVPIHEAAERYVFVYGGKGTLFDAVDHSLVPKADVVDMLPEHGWRDLRGIKRVARLTEVGFDPAGADANIRCNLYAGWPTTPKAGDCQRLLDLLEFLCSTDPNARELYRWVLRWFAYPIQKPGAKMRTAIIFHGPQGTGKNLWNESVMAIYGKYGRIVDQVAIEDKFNDWASQKLFLIADEVVARQELYHVKNKLKQFVTGEWIRINPKNVAAHDEKNHVNVVFLSNEIKPLILEDDDRRYCVVHVPPAAPADFYQEIRDCINAGGIEALHDFLLNVDLDGFDEHSKPPLTQAKQNLIELGLGSVERFFREWTRGETAWPVCPCASSDLYRAYRKWCEREGIPKPREASELCGYIRNQPGWVYDHKDRYETAYYTGATKRQRMVIPSKTTLAALAKAGGKDYQQPPQQTQTQWLTDGWLDFANALCGEPEHDRSTTA